MAIGIEQNRLSLLLAVLEKRAGLSLAGDDVYVNIAGGMSIEEPAADLSVVAAVASSVRNRGLSPSTAVFGEVGLSGEIRGIPQAPLRIREAVQMGFTRVVLPAANVDASEPTGGTSASLLGEFRTIDACSLTDPGEFSQFGDSKLGVLDSLDECLVEIATSTPLLTATSHASESFDIVSNYYSNVVAEESARARAVEEVRRDIMNQLTVFLQRQAATAAASP